MTDTRKFFKEIPNIVNGQLVSISIGEVTQEQIDHALSFERRRKELDEAQRQLRRELKRL